jgi:hypothetical protein
MKKLQVLVLSAVMALGLGLSGCVGVHAEEHCMSKKEKERFAEMVAKKVIELQEHKEHSDEVK